MKPPRLQTFAVLLVVAAGSFLCLNAQSVPVSESAIRPQLQLRLGHSFGVIAATFSKDANYLVTASYDAVCVWHTETGLQLRNLKDGGGFTSVALSPDGRYVVAGSRNRSAILWDLNTGEVIRRFQGHSDRVSAVAFSSDGRKILTGSYDKSAWLWETSSAHPISRFVGHGDQVNTVAFSPDNKWVVTGSSDGEMRLWYPETGQMAKRFRHELPVLSVTISADGRLGLSSSQDQSAHLWDLSKGNEIKRFRLPSNQVFFAAFLADNQGILTGGYEEAQLWDIKTASVIRKIPWHSNTINCADVSGDGHFIALGGSERGALIWDLRSGREYLRVRSTSDTVDSIQSSPDGNSILTGTFTDRFILTGDIPGAGHLWNSSRGEQIRRFDFSSNNAEMSDEELPQIFRFSYDSRFFATITGETRSSESGDLWSDQIRKKEGDFFKTEFSPDSRLVLVFNNGTTRLTETITKRVINDFGNKDARFSPNGKYIVTWERGNDEIGRKIALRNGSTGREIRLLRGADFLTFSSDSNLAVTADRNGHYVLNVMTGKVIYTIAENSGTNETYLAFLPQDKLLLTGKGSLGGTPAEYISFSHRRDTNILIGKGGSLGYAQAHLRDAFGKELLTFNNLTGFGFSPYGGLLVTETRNLTENRFAARLWDLRTRKEIPSTGQWLIPLSYSQKNRFILARTEKGLKVLNGQTGGDVCSIKGEDGIVLPDGNSVISAYQGLALVSSLAAGTEGREICRLISLDDGNWLAVTPEGLFDGSPNGWKQILWTFENNMSRFAPVEAFFKEYWRPGLLADIMAGKHPEPPKKDLSAIDIRQPEVRIMSVDEQVPPEKAPAQPVKLSTSIRKRNIEVRIKVTDNITPPSHSVRPSSSGAKDLRLFRNGSLVKLWQGSIFDKQLGCEQIPTKLSEPRQVICKTTVSVVAGDNNFTAYAFNDDNVKSADAEIAATGAERLHRKDATTHILAIGINKYADNGLPNRPYFRDLVFAETDAEAFSSQISLRQKVLGRQTDVVGPLYSEDAKKESILAALKTLARQVEPEDSVVIYFSGHGKATKDGRFYLIPTDIGYPNLAQILQHSISDRDLEEIFRSMDAAQILLIIDACNSGQALEADDPRRGPMNSQGLGQLAYEKGMYVLAAAQGYQAATEQRELKQSLLTSILLGDGLTAKADTVAPFGQITTRKWFDYTARAVPTKQRELIEQFRRQRKEFSFVDGQKKDGDHLQKPRVFYRRETDTHPFVVTVLNVKR